MSTDAPDRSDHRADQDQGQDHPGQQPEAAVDTQGSLTGSEHAASSQVGEAQLPERMTPFTADRPRRRDPEARLRVAAVGCLLAAGALILALSASQALFSRWVSSTVLQTRKAVETRLPPYERREVVDRLDRFFATLATREDRDELTGQFMRMAQEMLNDGRISHEEADELTAWLEEVQVEDLTPAQENGS